MVFIPAQMRRQMPECLEDAVTSSGRFSQVFLWSAAVLPVLQTTLPLGQQCLKPLANGRPASGTWV